MHIGVVTTSYPEHPGDWAGIFVAEHAAWMARAGHRVSVIAGTSNRRATERGRAMAGAPAVHWIPGGALFSGGGAPERLAGPGRAWLDAARFSARLTGAVAARARGWDGAVAHWLAPSALAVAIAAPRTPTVAIAHSGGVHLLARLGLIGAAARLLNRPWIELVFVSEELRRIFFDGISSRSVARELWSRSMVCAMGIDSERIRNAEPEPRGDRPRVVFVGRLVEIKGVDVLLAAAARWQCDAELVIAGDGPLRASLHNRARELGVDADFRGALSVAARDRLLASADVVAIPSRAVESDRREGAPMIAAEALAAGAALVVSRTGGLAALGPDRALAVPPEDPVALAEAIDRALREADSRRLVSVSDRDWSAVGPVLWQGMERALSRL